MAGGQAQRFGAGETTAEFMERRRREVARRDEAEAEGRKAWAASSRTGQNFSAPRPQDVVALGYRMLETRDEAQRRPDPRPQPAVQPRPERSVAVSAPLQHGRNAAPIGVQSISYRSGDKVASPVARPTAGAGSRYGNLYAPPPDDPVELRQQQAEFRRTTDEIANRNSWMAIPALAAPVAALGLSGLGALSGRAVGAGAVTGPLSFLDREAWQRGAERAAQALSEKAKDALREKARLKYARANGVSASEMGGHVHHSDPLEWAHLKPKADPNRLANLSGLQGDIHSIATTAWRNFKSSLNGRTPTQAELMEAKLRIERMVENYTLRPGVSRPMKPPGKGGSR